MGFKMDVLNGDEISIIDGKHIELVVWGDCSNGACETVTVKLTPKEAKQLGRALKVYGELHDLES